MLGIQDLFVILFAVSVLALFITGYLFGRLRGLREWRDSIRVHEDIVTNKRMELAKFHMEKASEKVAEADEQLKHMQEDRRG